MKTTDCLNRLMFPLVLVIGMTGTSSAHTNEPSAPLTVYAVDPTNPQVSYDEDPYVYSPAVPRGTVRRSALKHLVETFYEGSVEQAVAALLGGEGSRLTDEQLDRIEDLIRKARKEGA